MVKMHNQEADIREGTISFWIDENKIQFNDNKIAQLFQLSPLNGSIFLVKDNDNKLKFFHVYIGKGRTDVEHDVSNLEPNKRHMIAVTWSVKNREIVMYIDGKNVANTKINYE